MARVTFHEDTPRPIPCLTAVAIWSRSRRRVALLIGLIQAAAGCATPRRVTPTAPTIALHIHLGKSEFFEGEPVYVVFEARNPGPDTAWTPPFGLAAHWSSATLERDGAAVPVAREMWVDYVFPPRYRGSPLPPGRSLFETATLQSRWGHAGPLSNTLYFDELPRGNYRLTLSFNLSVPGSSQPGEVVKSEPVSFRIRPRTAQEDSAYTQFERLASRLDVRAWQPPLLDTVITWAEGRLVADSLDAFAGLMLNEALVKAEVTRSVTDSGLARVARIDSAIAMVQRGLPAGAMAAERLCAPWLRGQNAAWGLLPLLGESLAGAVVREQEARGPARP